MRLNDADNRTAAHALDEVHPERDARNFRGARDLRNFGFPVFKLGAFAGRAGGLSHALQYSARASRGAGRFDFDNTKKGEL